MKNIREISNGFKNQIDPNGKRLIFLSFLVFGLAQLCQSQPVKCIDSDGNEYKTVKIGNQIWMAENLRTRSYNNGQKISLQLSDEVDEDSKISQEGHIIEVNSSNGKVFLYDWDAVNKGICPAGWRVPSIWEWVELMNYVGEDKYAKSYKAISGWPSIEIGGYWDMVTCSNCNNWNNEYRSKVPCHVCKDNRKVKGKYHPREVIDLNGNNSLGFNVLNLCTKPFHERSGFKEKSHLRECEGEPIWWSSTEIQTSDKAYYVDHEGYGKFKDVLDKAVAVPLEYLEDLGWSPETLIESGNFYISERKESMYQVRCIANSSQETNSLEEKTEDSQNETDTKLTVSMALEKVLEIPDTVVNTKDLVSVHFKKGGKMYSISDYYYDNGNKKSTSSRLLLAGSSRLHGEQKWYNESGQLTSKGFYDDGLKSGKWIWYFDNGQIELMKYYSEGVEDGSVIKYFPNGKTKYSGGYYEGKRNGIWIWYHDNGVISSKGEYSNGRKIGQFIFYNEDGSVMQIDNY